MKKLVFVFVIFFQFSVFAQDTIKVMSYNLLNYNNYTSYCTTTNNSQAAKDGYLRTIFSHVKPDIFGAIEVAGASYTSSKHILDSVINVNGVTWYKRANFINSNGSDIISTLFYNSKKLTLYNQNYLSTSVRDIMIYNLYYNSPDVSALNDTVFLRCVVMHLKAGSTASDLTQRDAETNTLMNYLNGLPSMGNCIVMGDFNVQSSNEDCFQNLVNYSNSNVRFYDPVSKLGDWNNNSSFAAYHTQSTSLSGNGCLASGGMDDRFDFILASFYVMNNISKVAYVSNSYWAVGQDGNHYNQSVNSGTNNSVPSNVLTALANMSDHLPVTLKLKISQTPAAGINSQEYLLDNIKFENPVNDIAEFQVYSNVQDKYIVTMYNQLGENIYRITVPVYPGYNTINVPTSSCSQGLYFVNFSGVNKSSTVKIVKK